MPDLVVRNPINGYTRRHELCGLWALLAAPLYFAIVGVWKHAILSFLAACFTCGLSNVVYAFAARDLIRDHYLTRGWTETNP